MKKSSILLIMTACAVAFGFSGCSSDEPEQKTNSNMSGVVKVTERGSTAGVTTNGISQRTVQGNDGYYTLSSNKEESKTPADPSASYISRAASDSSSKSGGTWTFTDTKTPGSEVITFAGTFTGDVMVNISDLNMKVTSTLDSVSGVLVAVKEEKSFKFSLDKDQYLVATIPEVTIDSENKKLSYSALRLPEPVGDDVFAGKTFECESVLWVSEADMPDGSGSCTTTGKLTESFSFENQTAGIANVVHAYTVVKEATAEEVLTAQEFSYEVYYSYDSEKKVLYLKLKNVVYVSIGERIVLENCQTQAAFDKAVSDFFGTSQNVIKKYEYPVPSFTDLFATKNYRLVNDQTTGEEGKIEIVTETEINDSPSMS